MNPLVYVVLIIQVIASLGLIIFVLLHSGKGTGVSSMFGGAMPSTASGTGIIEKNLDRITIGLSITWVVCLVILMITYQP